MPEPLIQCRSKLCKKEYPKRLLYCPFCDTVGIDKLYRYLSYDDRALSILRDKEIYFPSAHKLNDPFEFQFHLKTSTVHGNVINKASLEDAKRQMKNYGVLALSEVNDNILMMPSFFPLELENSKAVTQALSTKGEYWAYEREWRILTYESDKQFPLPGKITSVIFGLNMPQRDRDAVVSLLGYTVQYFEAIRSERYFALDISSVLI